MDDPPDLAARLARRDRFMELLGVELVEAHRGTCVLDLRVAAEHLNFNGTCHGAVLYALADCAFALSSNAYGAVAAGIDTHVAYSAPAVEGDVIRARCREIARSRRLATYQVHIEREAMLLALFTGTAYVTSRTHDDDSR